MRQLHWFLLWSMQLPYKIAMVLKALVFCLQRRVSRLKNASDLKLDVGMSSEAKTTTTVNDYWLFGIKKRNIPWDLARKPHFQCPGLAAILACRAFCLSMADFIRAMQNKIYSLLYHFHHYFILDLYVPQSHRKRLCDWKPQADGKIWQKICKRCSEGVTISSDYLDLTTSIKKLTIGAASVGSLWSLVHLSLEQRETAQNMFVAKRPMTPARVFTLPFLTLPCIGNTQLISSLHLQRGWICFV